MDAAEESAEARNPFVDRMEHRIPLLGILQVSAKAKKRSGSMQNAMQPALKCFPFRKKRIS